MFLSGALAALSHLPPNMLLAAAGAGALVLIVAAWQVRAAVLRRRARRRPLALVLSDAILVGSNSPRLAGTKARGAAHPVTPALSELQNVNAHQDQWGFTVKDGDAAILTFVYPNKQKAQTAWKAMQRLCKNAAFVLQPGRSQAIGAQPVTPPPTTTPPPTQPHPERAAAKRPWELDVGLDPITRSYVPPAQPRA